MFLYGMIIYSIRHNSILVVCNMVCGVLLHSFSEKKKADFLTLLFRFPFYYLTFFQRFLNINKTLVLTATK